MEVMYGILELLLSVKWKVVNLLEASLKPKRVEEFILKRHIFGIPSIPVSILYLLLYFLEYAQVVLF